MPTYEYRCTKCAVEFERFQQMSEASILECPECNGRVQRLISGGGGLLFKGTGFYATDYRSERPSSGSKEADSGTSKQTSPGKSDSGTSKQTSPGKSDSGTSKQTSPDKSDSGSKKQKSAGKSDGGSNKE